MKQFTKFSIPYFIWLLVLVVVPIIVMLVLTFMSSSGTDFQTATASIESYKRLSDISLLKALINSLRVALYTVILCILLGYPCAYFLSF